MYILAWDWLHPIRSAGEAILSFFTGILLSLDAIVYSFISWVYQIILVLCGGNILGNTNAIDELIKRLYVIIGVIMLFLVAYSLLRSMINPDEALKGKQSPVVIIKNVIISIVLIAFIPTIFDFAMGFQQSILEQGTIGKLILGTTDTNQASENKNMIDRGGTMIASSVLGGFLHPNINDGTCTLAEDGTYDCPNLVIDNDTDNYNEWWEDLENSGNFLKISDLNEFIVNGKVTYYWVISTIAGVFVLFVLLGYCFDIALRMVKLAVCQLIAPLPILCRVVPNEQASKVFSNWVKATLSIYLEVFIRMAVLFFAVFIIKVVTNNIPNLFTSFGSGAAPEIVLFAQILVIIGIILFIKQAPEIIKEITGLDGGKYNPLKSAKQGLSMIAGGIAGRSPLAAVRAWEQAGQAKNLLDFSAIGNQYKRRQAKLEAKEQGASMRDRTGDKLRKAFGFETKLEEANRRIERGLDMNGNVQTFTNDTDGDIVLLNDDGSIFKTIAKGATIDLDDKTINALQNKKDKNAQTLSQLDEQIRHVKEGKDLDQKYIDLRGKIKKKALEKINEGHNHIKKDLIYTFDDGTGPKTVTKTQMNYAAMKAYKESRINDGASAEEIQALETAIMQNEDDMWVTYSNWAIDHDKGGEISTWYDQAMQYHNDVGLYDYTTGKIFRYDAADLNAQMSTIKNGYADKMAFFESKAIQTVNKDGSIRYEMERDANGQLQYVLDAAGNRVTTTRGLDKTAKKHANGADTIVQEIEIQKTSTDDETKRIDRMTKQLEEKKTELKSSATYQAYKASDNANKINDSGKSGS